VQWMATASRVISAATEHVPQSVTMAAAAAAVEGINAQVEFAKPETAAMLRARDPARPAQVELAQIAVQAANCLW